jgi:hypothetical protein
LLSLPYKAILHCNKAFVVQQSCDRVIRMARYIVSSLKSTTTPAGVVLDRVVGPGWAATPAALLDMLEDGHHEFLLEDSDHRLAARRDGRGTLRIMVVDGSGREVPANQLPHWQFDDHRQRPAARRTWFQRLIDPDAA